MIAAWLFIRQYWPFVAGMALAAMFAVSLALARHGGYSDGQESERAIFRAKIAEREKQIADDARIQAEKNAAAMSSYASAAIAREKHWTKIVGGLKDDLKSPVYSECNITESGWLLHESGVTDSDPEADTTTMPTASASN